MKLEASVKAAVRAVLPKGARFRLAFETLPFSKTQIVRVVTPAWKGLPRSERACRVHKAIQERLSPNELERIFRVSVLTAPEFSRLRAFLPDTRLRRFPNGRRQRRKS